MVFVPDMYCIVYNFNQTSVAGSVFIGEILFIFVLKEHGMTAWHNRVGSGEHVL